METTLMGSRSSPVLDQAVAQAGPRRKNAFTVGRYGHVLLDAMRRNFKPMYLSRRCASEWIFLRIWSN